MGRLWKMLAATALIATAASAARAQPSRYAIEIGAAALNHDGYLQTPTGGEPGTASPSRPSLAELAVEDGCYRWIAGTVRLGRYTAGVRYTAIGDAGRARLAEPLISQGQAFPAGDGVRTDLALDGLSLTVTRSFELAAGTRLSVGPWLGWTAFDLQIGGTGSRVDRSYRVYALGGHARLEKDLGKRWRIRAEATAAPAFQGAAARFYVEPSLIFGLTPAFEIGLAARLGTFHYDDAHKQTLPNRLDVDRRLLPAISVRWRP